MNETKITTNSKSQELTEKPINSSLWNKDLDPIAIKSRNWTTFNVATLWMGISICIPTYMLGSGLIDSGMNWWQATLTVFLGNMIVICPMVLIGHAGTKYGISFPVLLRAPFGTEGARAASLLRAFVACGWFGILSWIGSNAVYQLLLTVFPSFACTRYLGDFIGLNVAQLVCFLLFCVSQMVIVHNGTDAIRRLSNFAAPLLVMTGILLLGWAWVKTQSFSKMLEASYSLKGATSVSVWKIFWPGLTSIVGFWSALVLNIPDFTRFVRSQKDQALGQLIGLPPTVTFYAFIGIAVTSATIIIFGKPIWDPVILLGEFKNPVIIFIATFSIALATICCNIMANVISPANAFSNLLPSKISFRTGCYITGIIGVLIAPWKLIADPQGYIFRWLLAYSALLGSIGGIVLCDYYVLRRTNLNLYDLFVHKGNYTYTKGWNLLAYVTFFLSIIPNIPGFLVKVGVVGEGTFASWVTSLYDYAWFISFGLAFIIYWLLMSIFNKTCSVATTKNSIKSA